MAVSVGADIKNPTHDMSLSDGVTTVGLLLADRNGNRDALAIKRSPFPRQSTKISQTNNQYSDLEPPYYALAQSDWSGGRGSLNYEDDTARFMDSFRAWTDQEKQIVCGPQETYSTKYQVNTPGNIYKYIYQSIPGKVNFTALQDANAYLGHSFTSTAAATSAKIGVIVKRVGTPDGGLNIELWTDVAGAPGVQQASVTLSTTDIADTISVWREVAIAQALATSTWWVVVHQASGTPTTANHWEVGTNPDAATNTKKSTDGATWSAASYELYYRVVDSVDMNFKFFEYKRAVYAIDLTHGRLYLNGDRGAADSNAGALTTLVDAAKTGANAWINDMWANCIVLITKGTGSIEQQPWRVISSNTATTLTVSPAWEITHDTTTEYVILGSDRWQHVAYLGGSDMTVTDVAIAGDIVYFAYGDVNALFNYVAYNLNGVWVADGKEQKSGDIAIRADKLCAINTPTGWELWGGFNNHSKHGSCVWKANVPNKFADSSTLYNLVTVLDDGKGVWDERSVANVTVSQTDDGMEIALAAGFTTGDAASKEITPTDITKGTHIGALIKSSVATAAGDITLKLDDSPLLARNYLPDHIWHYDTEVNPSHVTWKRGWINPYSVYYFDASENTATAGKGWHRLGNLEDNEATFDYHLNYDYVGAAEYDYIYVSFAEKFEGVYFTLGATKNAVDPSTLSAQYWNGLSWATMAITSDGTKPGTITLAQSGLVVITAANDWAKGCDVNATDLQGSILASDQYHVRFYFDKDLTADVEVGSLTVHAVTPSTGTSDYQIVELYNSHDIKTNFNSQLFIYDNDEIYLVYSKRFNAIKFVLESANNNASAMTGWYWTGTAWAAATTGWSDGTASGGATLAASGPVTFTMPSDWNAGCPAYLQEYLGATDYVFKLIFNVTDASLVTDANIIDEITLEDSSTEEIYEWKEKTNCKDGDVATLDTLNITTDDFFYVLHAEKFNKVYWNLGTVNAVDTTINAQFFDGNNWATLTITTDGTATAGNTLHQDGAMIFTIPHNWQPISINGETGYAVRFYPTADLAANITILELYVQNDDATALSIPALTANVWAYVEMPITPNANPNPDDSKIVSIGLNVAVDNGAQTVTIGKIELITEAMDYYKLGNTRINSIESYGDERQNPWVFTEDMVYEIQTQNNYAIIPMPLREIRALSSENNGVAHTVSNVYLVFNLGSFIEQYYQHNLDDIGPNRDEGLPSNRQGDPVCLMSYPGRIFLAIDASTSGYSTILMKKSSGWHEIYRAPYGCPIHDLAVQVVPGKSTRLWVSQEYDILWLPLPTDTWNPKNDSDFRYTHESVITTGWFTCGFMDISKFWNSVKLYTENLSGTDQFIKCEYQTEDGGLETGTQWTAISDVFDTSPYEEQKLNASYNVTARRIRFRFKLITTSNLESPILKASVVEALLRFPVKYMYSATVLLADHEEDLTGVADMAARVETKTAQLETWSDAPTVLTMRCNYSPYDNKKVVLEPMDSKPIPYNATAEQLEKHLADITVLSVE